jgi:acetylornithine deacetylase/succinyl-diaminopimelate desuccinylase-like protein
VLEVEVLTEGVHSGDASGVVASSFRVARLLLERIEDPETGVIGPAAFHAPIPPERGEQAKRAAAVLGEEIWRKFPFVKGMAPMAEDLADLVLNRTWRPALAVTGAEGLPAPANAGNVLLPKTTLALSMRLPPTAAAKKAAMQLKTLLESDPPYGAKVGFSAGQAADGWNAPPTASWLEKTLSAASKTHFGREVMWMGEGGTIPFMAMLGAKFPEAQFVITGVLGPHSNAHGPNEFLHIEYAKKLTACVADILAAQARS